MHNFIVFKANLHNFKKNNQNKTATKQAKKTIKKNNEILFLILSFAKLILFIPDKNIIQKKEKTN